jgi:hypothetical protein
LARRGRVSIGLFNRESGAVAYIVQVFFSAGGPHERRSVIAKYSVEPGKGHGKCNGWELQVRRTNDRSAERTGGDGGVGDAFGVERNHRTGAPVVVHPGDVFGVIYTNITTNNTVDVAVLFPVGHHPNVPHPSPQILPDSLMPVALS